jgi:M6 family metalloprotease-like protein
MVRIIDQNSVRGFFLVLVVIVVGGVAAFEPFTECVATTASAEEAQRAADGWPNWTRNMNPLHMLVVFTKFKGEAPVDVSAPVWADLLFADEQRSVPGFFSEVSYGKFDVSGEYYPHRMELSHDASYYVDNKNAFTTEVLTMLNDDPSFDFSKFDNDGKDGVPASRDDDRFMDWLVIMPMSRPDNFFFLGATAIASLYLKDTFFATDRNVNGNLIMVDDDSGCFAQASNFNQALSSIIIELSHAYGARDLMDLLAKGNADDSGGCGYWDFLARGTLGWEEKNGPMGPNAYNRMLMDCAGPDNTHIVDLVGYHQDVRIKDISALDGNVYRLWISEPTAPLHRQEYFLLENRRNDGFSFDRNIPENGLFIWHILNGTTNSDEMMKTCDLECPDGRFADAGYPAGKLPDPIHGGDNLDFWAHDDSYSRHYGGNLGDAFDMFDGSRYTRFDGTTNPNSFSKITERDSGIRVFNICRDGRDMLFDCIVPPFYNWFDERFPYIGSAMHRFTGPLDMLSEKPVTPEVYLVRFGNDRAPGAIVTVADNEAIVESLDGIEHHVVESAVNRRLMPGVDDWNNSRIERKNISMDRFAEVLSTYNISIEDLGGESAPGLVQKVARVEGGQPPKYTVSLMPNFPNPFNASTTIAYTMYREGPASLEVYNLLGQRIMQLDQGVVPPGLHSVVLDGDGLSSGVYIYRITGVGVSDAQKFTLIK